MMKKNAIKDIRIITQEDLNAYGQVAQESLQELLLVFYRSLSSFSPRELEKALLVSPLESSYKSYLNGVIQNMTLDDKNPREEMKEYNFKDESLIDSMRINYREKASCIIKNPILIEAVVNIQIYHRFIVGKFLTPESILAVIQEGETSFLKVMKKMTNQVYDLYGSEPGLLFLYGLGFSGANIKTNLSFIQSGLITENDKILDLGGSFGFLGELMNLSFDEISYHSYDLAQVKEIFNTKIEQYESENRNFKFIEGDFFEGSPDSLINIESEVKYSKIILGWVIHDWDDAECLRILKKAKGHLAEGGKIIILDIIADKKDEVVSFIDWVLLSMANGKERTLEEFQFLASESGLALDLFQQEEMGRSILCLTEK
jgi:hypothetical protein